MSQKWDFQCREEGVLLSHKKVNTLMRRKFNILMSQKMVFVMPQKMISKISNVICRKFWIFITRRVINAKLISEAWSIFAISNEKIQKSNKMIWYFHSFWNSDWKEIARPSAKTKKGKLKTKTNRRRKWIKEIKVILHSCWKSF